MLVHVGGTCDSIFLSQMNEFENLSFVADVDFGEVFDVRAKFVLSDFEIAFTHIKKIPDFLHIELEDWNFQLVLDWFSWLLNRVE